MSQTIQTLSRQHIPLILQLESHSAPPSPLYWAYDEEELTSIFDRPDSCEAVGIFEGDTLIAWGSYTPTGDHGDKDAGVFQIGSVMVDVNQRGKGLGKTILNEVVSRIKAHQKFKKIYLTVSPLNKHALMLYLKNGFLIYDFKKDVYGPGMDRVFLELI